MCVLTYMRRGFIAGFLQIGPARRRYTFGANGLLAGVGPMYHYQTCGLDDVYLANGYEVTSYGGERAVSIHDLSGLHRAIANTLVCKPERLSGKEIRFLRIEMELSQAGLGVTLGVSDQTIAKWEKEQAKIPRPAELLLRAYARARIVNANGLVSEFIEYLAAVDEREIERLAFQETESGWEPTEKAA